MPGIGTQATPESKEQEQWLAKATNAGRLGGSAAGVIAAFLAIVPALANRNDGVAIAMVAGASVAIVVSAAVVITDLLVRGRVKVAQLQKAATAAVSAPAPSAAAAAPETPAQWHPVAVPMAVTFSGGSDRWGVVAVRSEAGGTSSLLVGRTGQPLQVVREDQVGETFYESNPGQYEPRVGP